MQRKKIENANSADKKNPLEKDRTKKDVADKTKPRCSICGKYTDKKTSPQCFGHGGGSGGGGGSSEKSASKGDSIASGNAAGKTSDTVVGAANLVTEMITTNPGQQPEIGEKPFNPEIISELLSKQLLVIDNDRELGTLTIKLQYDPTLLSAEQRNELKIFFSAIINELDQFKKVNNISAECKTIEQDKNGNILSLRIMLPTPTLYDAFIQRLANKSLLPIQNIEQQAKEKVVYQDGVNHFNPTPLSTKPIPASKINTKTQEEDLHKTEKQSTSQEKKSIHPKSP